MLASHQSLFSHTSSCAATGDLEQVAGGGGGQLAPGGSARRARPSPSLGPGLVPNRDSSASLNTWLGRESSRPASVQGDELLGAEKVLRRGPPAGGQCAQGIVPFQGRRLPCLHA